MDLSELARHVAPEYARTGKVTALIAAAVGRNRQDSFSDLELDVYWAAPPSSKQCTRIPEIILGALCGLNHRFIEHHSFKWFAATIEQFAIAPPDLAARLHAACDGDLCTAITELDRLLDETIDLVGTHLPTVDLSPIRAELEATR